MEFILGEEPARSTGKIPNRKGGIDKNRGGFGKHAGEAVFLREAGGVSKVTCLARSPGRIVRLNRG